MKTALRRLGNARAIVIPEDIVSECGLDREVEMRVEGKQLILRSTAAARAGWKQAFEQATSSSKDGAILPDHMSEDWDREEWTW